MPDETIEDLIRLEAYAIYQVRRKYGIGGDEKSDWFEAQEKIRHAAIKDAEEIISKDVKKKLENGY